MINTIHFQEVNGPQVDAEVITRIRDTVTDFYTGFVAEPGGGASIAELMSLCISRTKQTEIHITKRPADFLNVIGDGETWGSPNASFGINLPASLGGLSMPAEVSIVLSFKADYAGLPERGPNKTRPRATRRNRLFLGPWTSFAFQNDVNTGKSVVKAQPTIVGAAERLMAAGAGALDIVQWATYSQKLHDAFRVVGGWVDNAPDTQRRRGEDATARSNFGLV